ncbi:IS200/IS605 family transposase, partial [Lacticaseibacillus chiayiensis]
PTSAIKALKGRSAFIFLKRHPEIRDSQDWGGHLWSPSYYMSTLGNMSKDVVENYINNQKYNELKKRPKRR